MTTRARATRGSGDRPMRWMTHLAVVLLVALVPAGQAMAAGTPATGAVAAGAVAAAPAAPSPRIVPGDRTLTVAWPAAGHATRYVVHYSTSPSMTGARAVSAPSGAGTAIRNLVNNRRYYVRVVAVGAGGATSGSRVLSARPEAGYPGLLTVTARPAGVNQIRVRWTGQTRATKVAVIAGSEGGLRQHPFNSGFYPATTTSVTLTVPARYRAYLGTGSGNPIFVKVATYNSATAGSSLPRTKSVARAYRLSLAGTYSYAGGVVWPEGRAIRVAEWNVNSVAATANMPGYTWADRRTKVAAGIVRSGASLVATAELTTADAGVGQGLRQWEDLANLLRPHGYRIANDPGPAGPNATKGAHLFYRPSVMTRLAGGMISPRDLGISWPSGLVVRYLSWAKFRLVSTGTVFFAVAVHLPPDTATRSYRSLRVTEARALDSFIAAKAGRDTVIVAGDFNSSFLGSDTDPVAALRGRGYFDTSAASRRSNPRISTANITRQVDNPDVPGYPTRPYVYQYPAPRIDYILAKNSSGSTRYVNQVVLADGHFDRRYQGSDHNLQWADVVVRGRTSGWLLCGERCRSGG